ncbi:helix-turn-helix domain-containing protein [Limimaricola sp. G21655-S1]|uniref:helix-turn-helix domain-containing protein n=1 Tax=Limimaricola sp. G21655-S1 TaxID=3014768 RepID=UPI0022B002FC|nr:helix-turn-helix domain-containing protein [Limimaricola sp. G21655-S1]MCZ4262228.1 helix-turn-helix domain-containing protein [Limimaricola sp. G21655-S1]
MTPLVTALAISAARTRGLIPCQDQPDEEKMLSIEEVARHFRLRPDTVRRKIRAREIDAVRIGRVYRLAWPDVWACEDGPMPKRALTARYQDDLLTKKDIAAALSVSVRTVERWIEDGMPTRNVFRVVRCNPHDVSDWLKRRGIDLPAEWWR